MTYTDSDLRKLQLVDLYTLLEVKRICELHDIKYFLTGGTLLGAVRHKGFIPWDDDVDVGMLREEYQKFLEICKSELRPEFYIQTKETDETYPHPFAKLRVRETVRIEEGFNYSSPDARGIDIDIFPHDNFPKNELMRRILPNMFSKIWGIYTYKCGCEANIKDTIISRFMGKLGKLVSYIIPKRILSKIMDIPLYLYNGNPTEYVMNYGGYGYPREMKKREIVSNLTQLPFEKNMFSCPVDYDSFLRTHYDDTYMCLPKEEDRVQHRINTIEFGKYSDIDKIDPSELSEYRPPE